MKHIAIHSIITFGNLQRKKDFEDAAWSALKANPDLQMWKDKQSALQEIEDAGYEDMPWLRTKHNDVVAGWLISYRLCGCKDVIDIINDPATTHKDVDFLIGCTVGTQEMPS